MKISLRDLQEELNSLNYQLSPQELSLESEGADFARPMSVELVLRKSGDSFYGTGLIKTDVRLECSRCLKPYFHSLETKLDFYVRVEKDRIEIEYQDQAEPLIFPGNQSFSIDNLIKETLLLNLPLKPLCSEDCRGLCSACGANLNISNCNCKKEELDPRWEKLRNLKKG